MKRSGPLLRRKPMPRPSKPLERGSQLKRTELKRGESVLRSVQRIKPVSKKQRVKINNRAELRKDLVAERGPCCEVRSPVCTGREQGLHHLHKAGQGGEDSAENCLLSCNACNTYVEDFPPWAQANGFVVTREQIQARKGAA